MGTPKLLHYKLVSVATSVPYKPSTVTIHQKNQSSYMCDFVSTSNCADELYRILLHFTATTIIILESDNVVETIARNKVYSIG